MPDNLKESLDDFSRSSAELVRSFLDNYGIIMALVVMIVVLTIIKPDYFPTIGNLTNVARQISFNAMLALGEFIVILTAGIDLSVGSVTALSMVLLALTTHSGVPDAISLIVALAAGAL